MTPFGRKFFGFFPSYLYSKQIVDTSPSPPPPSPHTPQKMHTLSLLSAARSTSAFQGQLIPVRLPPQLTWDMGPGAWGQGGVGKVLSLLHLHRFQ